MILGVHDKNGINLSDADVVYNGQDFYQIYYRKQDDTIEMLSCKGYIHNVTQETLKDFFWIGTFEDNRNLFDCD